MTQPLSGQVVLSSIIEGVDTTGRVATFTDTNIGDTAGDFTATVNWGDGTTEVGTVTGQNGSFAVAVPGSTVIRSLPQKVVEFLESLSLRASRTSPRYSDDIK